MKGSDHIRIDNNVKIILDILKDFAEPRDLDIKIEKLDFENKILFRFRNENGHVGYAIDAYKIITTVNPRVIALDIISELLKTIVL